MPQGTYKIKSQVNLVVLHVSVLNDRSVFVPGLMEDGFRVLEDKVEQKLSVFKQEDVPVSFGLVVDNSGSMRDKRPQVNAAALTFVKTSNPQDEGFVVNFNDDYYLDTEHDFTSDLAEMRTALERIDARGSTALYDAVIGSLDHLKKGTRDKKVLLVVTDGEDNASRHSLENVVEQAQRADTVIYAVGVFSDDDIKHNHRAMKKARRRTERPGQRHRRAGLFSGNRRRHGIDLHADRPRYSQPIHARLLSDQYGARWIIPHRIGSSDATTRRGETHGAHAHRILRIPRAILRELVFCSSSSLRRTRGLARRERKPPRLKTRATAAAPHYFALKKLFQSFEICLRKLLPCGIAPPKFSAMVWPMSASVSRMPRLTPRFPAGLYVTMGTYSRE